MVILAYLYICKAFPHRGATLSIDGSAACKLADPKLLHGCDLPWHIPLQSHLRQDLYQNLWGTLGYEELLVQSSNDHRFQEDDFTYLPHDKMLSLHKVCTHPSTKKPRQCATAFPRKPTGLSPPIHHNGDLTKHAKEFLAILFFNTSWRLGIAAAIEIYSKLERKVSILFKPKGELAEVLTLVLSLTGN